MLGGNSALDPPLPIPNRTVKRSCADDSVHYACESRSLPGFLNKNAPTHKEIGAFLCSKLIEFIIR